MIVSSDGAAKPGPEVRRLFGPRQPVEVGQCRGAVQLEPHLPARANLEHEGHQTHPQQELPGIGDQLRIAPVLGLLEPEGEFREEVGHGPGQDPAQR